MEKIKCKFCGEEFMPGRGRKTDHCRKEDCLRKARNEANRKWYANKMGVLNGTKYRIIEQKQEKKVVYSSTERAIHSLENEDFTDVIELARELGAVRFKILEQLRKYSPDQSKCDTIDQVFLHKFEDLAKMDEVYVEDIIGLFVGQIDKRADRRIIKDKREMLQHLIQGCISNPTAYVSEFIKNRNSRVYTPKIIYTPKDKENK